MNKILTPNAWTLDKTGTEEKELPVDGRNNLYVRIDSQHDEDIYTLKFRRSHVQVPCHFLVNTSE